jgi:hypothetical protein
VSGDGSPVTHIAGTDFTVHGTHHRQRCGWCGAILLDADLTRLMVPVDQEGDGRLPFPAGRLVRVEGTFPVISTVLDDTEKLPDDACALLPPEMTA